jgi:O-antigen ligase
MLAAKETVRLTSLYSVFFLAFALYGRSPERFVRLLYLSLVVPVLVAVVQFVTGSSQVYSGDLMRIHGTFVHPNAFGRYLALFIILSLALVITRHVSLRRPWALLGVGAALFALVVFSYSRSSLIVCVLGIGILVFQGRRRSLPLVLGAAAVLAVVLGGRVIDRFSDLGVRPEVMQVLAEGGFSAIPVDADEGNSFEWRVLNWVALVQAGRDAPWFGYGTRTAWLVNPMRTRDDSGEMIGYAAHNEFVRAFVEHGLIGLILVVLATFMIIRGVVRARREVARAHIGKPMGDALLAMTVGMVATGLLAGDIFAATAVLYVFMSLAGVLYRSAVDSSGDRPARAQA